MPDSPRWCAFCQAHGDHHTDRHPPSYRADVRRAGDAPARTADLDGQEAADLLAYHLGDLKPGERALFVIEREAPPRGQEAPKP